MSDATRATVETVVDIVREHPLTVTVLVVLAVVIPGLVKVAAILHTL